MSDESTGAPFLREISLRAIPDSEAERHPFIVPAVAALCERDLRLESAVTVFVGENGSGKSTLLEGIAAAANSITVGSETIARDPSLEHARQLGEALRLTWSRRTRRGFFMRAEDFFGFAKRIEQSRREHQEGMDAIDESEGSSDYARALGKSAFARELSGISQRYGDGLDARSHGEAFLAFFQSRFVPEGLYLLDEPEAPLSPRRQLTLIAMLYDMTVTHGAQFIIATHSPLLMAIPGATIVGFDGGALERLDFEKVEHVALTRQFLENPEAYLHYLWTSAEI